ncbi:MAG: acetylxylan esterase [Opitutaceae bacterium]
MTNSWLRIFGCAVCLWLAGALTGFAGDLVLLGTTDNPKALYAPGEKMLFRIQLEQDGKPVIGRRLNWERTGDDGLSDRGSAQSENEPLLITTTLGKPGFVRVLVSAVDDAGEVIKNTSGKKVVFDGGAGVQPEKLRGVAEPADFDDYWGRQKTRLAKVALTTLELTPMAESDAKVETFDIKIASAGGMPVSGYFSKTKGAEPKSAGARLNFQGYGVTSATRADAQANDPGKPMLVLTINAHGIENGRAAEFYENLKQTTLKGYAFDSRKNANAETAYFNGMVLRVLRALEFLKAQPEWDGKTLIVSGGSQGGFQALIAAGLDHQVSYCFAGKPWCCDLGGVTLGRLKGWRPDYTDALGYFDPINHAKRIRCETSITAGLGDYVCPPSGVAVLYNNIPAGVPKTIEYRQGATHADAPPRMVKHVVSSK